MKAGEFEPVPYADNKHSLQLYECLETDHLAAQEWLDRHLRGDYLFKKNHLLSIIRRDTSKLICILFDGMYVGTVVYYKGSILHNLMISEEFRGRGIGEAVIAYLAPSVIRAKTNMCAGDPVPFYKKNGFVPVAVDPARPHIVEMRRPDATTQPVPDPREVTLPVQDTAGGASPGVLGPVPADLLADANKWRALKQRQRERQTKKKQHEADLDRVAAQQHLREVAVVQPPEFRNGYLDDPQFRHSE